MVQTVGNSGKRMLILLELFGAVFHYIWCGKGTPFHTFFLALHQARSQVVRFGGAK